MSKNHNDHIESFSADYRESSLNDSRHSDMRRVTGRSVQIKRERDANVENHLKAMQSSQNHVIYEQKRTPKPEQDVLYINTKSKSLYRGIIIVMTLLLTAAGIGIFAATLNKSSVMTSETVNYNNFNGFLYPVVMQDPSVFESPEKADKSMVISSSIWMTIFRNKAESYNSFDEQGYALIPTEEIKESCMALFGSADLIDFSKMIHGPFFYYNPGEDKMHVGAISNQGRPMPQIREDKEDDETLFLTVDYVLLGSPEEDPNHREVIKTMIYEMHLNKSTDKYYIYAVKQEK